MKFFLDTANIEEIKKANALGLLDGVTTNPTLIAKEGRPQEEVLREICRLVKGPVSAEVIGVVAEEMIDEGRKLAAIAENIVVKIPSTLEGLRAIRALKAEGIRTNMTLVFSLSQAILGAKVGADFLSPFVGRLDDISQRGMDLIRDIMQAIKNYNFNSQVIVASIRNPLHIVEAALIGVPIVTVPYHVFDQLMRHPLTEKGIERFIEDWKKIPR